MSEMRPGAADPVVAFKLNLSALRGDGLAFQAPGPADEMPADKTPADKTPADKTSAGAVLAAARPVGRIDAVTGILRQTPTGAATLDAIAGNGVRLVEDDARLDAMAPAGVTLMAAYDPDRRAILLRGGGKDGATDEATASLVVHEGRHALQHASGALGFQDRSWRLAPSAFMDAVRAVEADATALQVQFAAERQQAGNGQAWDFMQRNRPAELAAFERSMAARSGDWTAARAAVFDAFVGDARQTQVYVRFNLPQWVSSLEEAGRPEQIGTQSFSLDSLRATTRSGGGDYLDQVRPPEAWPSFDPAADRMLTDGARQLVSVMQQPPAVRGPLLDQPETQQALRLFGVSREAAATAPRWTPEPEQGGPQQRPAGLEPALRARSQDRGR